jgi:hypothetical protein
MTSSAYYFDQKEAERRIGRGVRNTAIASVFGVARGTRGHIVRAEKASGDCWQLVVEWETRYGSDRSLDRVNRFGYNHYLAEIDAVPQATPETAVTTP